MYENEEIIDLRKCTVGTVMLLRDGNTCVYKGRCPKKDPQLPHLVKYDSNNRPGRKSDGGQHNSNGVSDYRDIVKILEYAPAPPASKTYTIDTTPIDNKYEFKDDEKVSPCKFDGALLSEEPYEVVGRTRDGVYYIIEKRDANGKPIGMTRAKYIKPYHKKEAYYRGWIDVAVDLSKEGYYPGILGLVNDNTGDVIQWNYLGDGKKVPGDVDVNKLNPLLYEIK